MAFATEEGFTVKPDSAPPFYGYYFRRLDNQGAAAKGGAKSYVINGKMTGGFAYVAYPAKYDDTGIKTFIINQDGVVYAKDLGKDTENLAKVMTDFNPDNTLDRIEVEIGIGWRQTQILREIINRPNKQIPCTERRAV